MSEETILDESTLGIAINSESFQPVSEAELDTALAIAAVDEAFKEEQERIRLKAIEEFPLDAVLLLLNFEGEIGENEIAAAEEFYAEFVSETLTPEVMDQSDFYTAGIIVQASTEEF